MKVVLPALVVMAGWWGLSSFNYERYLSPTVLAQWLSDAGPLAPLILIGSMVCAVMIPPIPSLPLVLAAGAAFGPFDGALYALIGAEIGATLCFLVARAFGREALSRVMKTGAIFGQMRTDRQLMGMVFLARLIPIFSFEVSFGAGLTNISLKTFALATLLGMALPTFALTYLGSSMIGARWPLIVAGAAIVVALLAMPKLLTKYRTGVLARRLLRPPPARVLAASTRMEISPPDPLHWLRHRSREFIGLFSWSSRMTRLLLTPIFLIAGSSIGWTAEERAPSHWSYEGREGTDHWSMLSPAYMACEAGSHQSPINITMPNHATMQERLVFHYQSASVHTLDNGHTIRVNVPPGSELHLNGRTYHLGQFHFHEPSEHRVDGRTYPMEIHLVHQDTKGHIVVLAAFIETGPANQSLAELWAMLPTKTGEQGAEHVFNPHDLLPSSTHHFSYHGSLTTPPCMEGVQWIVLRDPITMSAEQVAQFVTVIGHNARPLQPLHGRRVHEE